MRCNNLKNFNKQKNMSTIGTIKELKDITPPPPRAPQQDMGDSIHTLPVDNNPVTDNDKKILSTFFTTPEASGKVIGEFKEGLIGAFLFIILSLPQVDEIILKFIDQKSPYILILIKAIAFVIGFYIVKNFMSKKR